MFDEKLIALVRQYTVLYDMSDPRYIDHKHKMKVWKLIGITLDMPALECKNRWTNIRDQFRRNLGKKPKSGQAAEKVKPYKYAKILEFLLPHLSERDTISNIPTRQVPRIIRSVIVDPKITPVVRVESETADNRQSMEPVTEPHPKITPVVPVGSEAAGNGQSQEPVAGPQSKITPAVPVGLETAGNGQSQEPVAGPQSKITPAVPVGLETAGNGQRQEPVAEPQEPIRLATRKRNRSVCDNEPTPATVLMEYILRNNDERNMPEHPMMSFLKSMGHILVTLSPRAQHAARGRIFSIVQELEYDSLNVSAREQQPLSSWVPPHTHVYDGPSTSQGFSSAPIHSEEEEEHENQDDEADNPQ